MSRLSRQVAALSGGAHGGPPEDAGPQQGIEYRQDPAIEPPVLVSGPVPQAVLWVDDNPANNAVLIDRLRAEGVRVAPAPRRPRP